MNATTRRASAALINACRVLGWECAYPLPRRSRTLPPYVVLAKPRVLARLKRRASKLDLRLHVKPSQLQGV